MKTQLLLLVCLGINVSWGGVYVNQIGYRPSHPKFVIVDQPADSFYVVDAATRAVQFSGRLTLWKSKDPGSGLTTYRGDFSPFNKVGTYLIKTTVGEESPSFTVQDSVYNPIWKMAMKGFYFQRCGMTLAIQHANIYYHPACHLSDATFHASAESTGVLNATGGWHDAGDFGKYVVNAGVTVGTLLLAYEKFPIRFAFDGLGIPESGNGTPDLLDETRYEIEWLLKMQASNGGVFTKLTRTQFESVVMPQADNGTRYIYQISSTATADFVAMMARAARVYQPFDASFAQRCLEAATKGWQFLEKSSGIVPAGGFRNPTGTATGEYGDGDDSDERLWAASEMLATTKDVKFKTYYQLYYSRKGLLNAGMSWQNVTGLAHLTYLTADFAGKDSTIVRDLKSSLQSFCQTHGARRNGSGFLVTLVPGEYVWGSNSVALNNAILLIMGYELLGDTSYRDVALEQLHYILGVNPNGTSYVTGAGTKRPYFPHHRPSAADNIFEPVPGLLAGGPDQYRDDPILSAKFSSSTPPALCYADDLGSYASNEIAINWNAPLVVVAGYFAYAPVSTGVLDRSARSPLSLKLGQNYPNPFNGTTLIPFELAKEDEITMRVFDTLGREVAVLPLGRMQPGFHTYQWDTSASTSVPLSSGVYFYQLLGRDRSSTLKLVLMK